LRPYFIKNLTLGFAAAAVLALIVSYAPLMQTIPNGSEHYTMIDVGETQIVLNVWGTLHATGYPLYVMMSSALTALLKMVGVSAATAPAVTSLIWGILALMLVYLIAARLTRPFFAALLVISFGLTRNIWLHHLIAEIYTFGLLIHMLLLLVALWTPPIKSRLFLLALIGGLGVAHHRATAMLIPALLFAVFADFRAAYNGRKLPRRLIACLVLGVIGFIPYIYLPLRANAGAAWVYGDPSTLQGLWHQFTGREAARFIGGVSSFDGLIANFQLVTNVLITDLTLGGLLIGIIGLVWGVINKTHRRAATTFVLSGAAAYVFHVAAYTDVLAALIIAVEVSLAFGWLFLVDRLWAWIKPHLNVTPLMGGAVLTIITAVYVVSLIGAHRDFLASLTSDNTGLDTIAAVEQVPPNSTVMIAWGPRHFAAGFAHDVWLVRRDVTLLDHNADYRPAFEAGTLITPDYTFFAFPPAWWEDRLGEPVTLNAAAPRWVSITSTPILYAHELQSSIEVVDARLACRPFALDLLVEWVSNGDQPDQSVFVHLLDVSGAVIDQDDQFAPVYGLRSLSTWIENEIVRDVYTLDRLNTGVTIRFGLYRQLADGSFENTLVRELPVLCDA